MKFHESLVGSILPPRAQFTDYENINPDIKIFPRQSGQRRCETDAVGHRRPGGIRRDYGCLLPRSSRLCTGLLGHRQGFLRCDTFLETQGGVCKSPATPSARQAYTALNTSILLYYNFFAISSFSSFAVYSLFNILTRLVSGSPRQPPHPFPGNSVYTRD